MSKLKILFAVFLFVALAGQLLAQGDPVRIKSGRLTVPGGVSNAGPAELVSDEFISEGQIRNTAQSAWENICPGLDCRPGETFVVGGGGFFDHLHRNGDFSVNGTTYQNAFYSGSFNLTTGIFEIPQIVRKRGRMFFSRRFEMNGFLRVCRVNDFANGCPSDQLLFEGPISGHGTMRVSMKARYAQTIGGFTGFLEPESFDYVFEE
ncbi:MAG: hypothetical protein R2747_06565 [Pyrinomonadaceae bacterium]